MTPAALRVVLAEHLDLEAENSQVVSRAYLDTFEGLVRQADMSLLWEDGWLQLLGGGGRAIAAMSFSPMPTVIRASELPPGALHDRLAPVIGLRAAIAHGHMRVGRRALRVLDREGKTVARLGIEEPSITPAGRRQARLATRLTITAVRGYDKALGQVRSVLEDTVGLTAARASLADEAVLAAGGTPSRHLAASDVRLEPQQRADLAAAAILTRLTAAIEANLPGTLADIDTEFLHDLRVAVRRTRSLQRELRGVFPQPELARFRAEFRWLQEITGPTRDLDVYLLEFDSFAGSLAAGRQSDLQELRVLLGERRSRAHARMVRALRSRRTQTLLTDWKRLVETLPGRSEDDRPDAARPIAELAAQRIGKVYRHMVRMGTRIDDQSPPAALHDLRKRGKELRYLLEFFAPLFPEATTQPMIKALKSLQDVLGRFQDREIQAQMLCSLGDEIAQQDGGAVALMAMGVLVERLEAQQAEARAEFAQRFAPFAAWRGDAAGKALLV
ncbi:MAG TPA: CHAD domain-containing protein [Solirubrobacteraceae bacterium]|nr:CHAD domain-containing protein [Solirubrobacteraceae bacterium]